MILMNLAVYSLDSIFMLGTSYTLIGDCRVDGLYVSAKKAS